MTSFIVLFIGLFSVVLILTPYARGVTVQNNELRNGIRTIQQHVAEMARSLDRYEMAFDRASEGITLQDGNGLILWCNPSYCQIHGRTRDEMIGRNPLEFALPDHLALTPQEIKDLKFDITDGEAKRYLNQRKTGELFWIELSSSFHTGRDGKKYAIVLSRDVTQQVKSEEHLNALTKRLEVEATHDALTGVANRAVFTTFTNKVIASGQNATLGLLHVDLDNFKEVNDSHGHAVGDDVLRHIASTIKDGIAETDLVARMGGDEFVVVCTQSADLADLKSIADRILSQLSEPFKIDNRTFQIEASIGAAQSQSADCDADALLVQADFALYEAKRAGRNRAMPYDADLHARHTLETTRSREVAQAIEEGTIDYAFQPCLNLETGQISGFEALVRWNHPTAGMLPPDEFLGLVSNLGLMGSLDLLAMTAALKKKAALNAMGFENIGIAFNASPDLLDHPDFISRLVWGVEGANIKRDHVTIEVLENTDFGDHARASSRAAIISDLRAAGFHVHLDDFGVGFAGLSHLAALDISGVKIDRSLVTNLLDDDVSFKVVRKMIELAQDLGLQVIAEGVEDNATADTLRRMGCETIQGYLLSKPLFDDEVLDWLADHQGYEKVVKSA